MSPTRAAALVLSVACLGASAPAFAQNPTALAKFAARSGLDTLVTPAALRALERLADSTAAADLEKEALAARPTASPPSPAAPRAGAPDRSVAPRTAVADTPVVPQAPAPSAGTGAITAIAALRTAERIELRVVAHGHGAPALSELFRSGTSSRIFLSFANTKLALLGTPFLDSAGPLFEGVDIAEHEGNVRIALELSALTGYGMEGAGDTTVLWFTQAAPAPVAAGAPAEPTTPRVAAPDELALARAAAAAGWKTFRADVATAAASIARLTMRGATATGTAAGHGWRTVTEGASWLAAEVPFAGIARTIVFLLLLMTPPVLAVRWLRRRNAGAHHHGAEIVGSCDHEAPARRDTTKRAPKQRAAKPTKSLRPVVTRSTADARLWAARTLADSGVDVAEIARQTGLSRDAAILLVRRTQKR